MSDYDNADPLAGSGLTADDHGEESWADERTPWDDPDEETEEEAESKESGDAVEDEASRLDKRNPAAQGLPELPPWNKPQKALRAGAVHVINFPSPYRQRVAWTGRTGPTGLRHFERRDVMPLHRMPAWNATDARLQIDSSRDGDSLTITLAGELDLGSVHDLETAILAAEQSDAKLIVVDLADVTFIDSTGLSQLLEAKGRSDGRFRVSPSHSDAVTQLLLVTGTSEILE